MKLDDTLIAQRETVVRTYCAAWGESDPAARQRLLRSCFEWTCRTSSLGRLPNARIVQRSKLETYREVGKFEWELVPGNGVVHLHGIDFVTFSRTGKLQSVVGFFDDA